MAAAQPLRIIQVGLGGWGRSWAAELTKRPDLVTTLAWVDVYPEMLVQLQAEVPVDPARCFTSLAEALAAVDVDAVLVTAALPGHASVAIEALAAGKHVLVEKPIAATLADARAMVDAAAAADRTLMVSQNYRFYPAARAAAELIAGGTLGAVGAVSVAFRKYGTAAPAGTSPHYQLADPLLLDMSIHHFDLMRFVLGQEPVSVSCHAWNPTWSHFVDPASAVATVVFDGGAVVDYQGSWASTGEPTLWAGEWVVECAGGTVAWTGRDNTTTDGDSVVVHPLEGEPYELELIADDVFDRLGSVAEFRSAIAEGREPMTSGRANLLTLDLTLGAIESSRTGLQYRTTKGTA
ncbi:Gfo/Idh/MocA family oxidoreductase [soil metagenome]